MKLDDLQKRMPDIPSLVNLTSLTVIGDVHFGKGIILRGNVIS
jgi:UTP--glucose-1-phosphate uridylyltransferase